MRNHEAFSVREATVNALLAAAKNAGMECSSEHPEDIAAAMSFAVENGWPVVQFFYDKNLTQTQEV